MTTVELMEVMLQYQKVIGDLQREIVELKRQAAMKDNFILHLEANIEEIYFRDKR